MVEARQVDEKRRMVLPEEFPPGSNVLIERVAADTWVLTRSPEQKNLKVVLIPMIERLPDDPEWEKVESAFGRAAYSKLPPPPED